MSYKKTITSLFELRRFGIRPGLTNIKKILRHLDNPHKELNFIHIAGTNGKGSTAAFIHSILNNSGYKTGLYTSPHLIDFCERIKIKNTQISKQKVTELIQHIKKVCVDHAIKNVTFFEFTTALAFIYFYQKKADPVVIETGLGGRLDTTNIITPLVSVITNIGLEHQKYLGNTISKITCEKGGIIKKNRPVVAGVKQQKSKNILADIAQRSGSDLFLAGRDFKIKVQSDNIFNYTSSFFDIKDIESGMVGNHQVINASLAIKSSEILNDSGYCISENNIRNGIKKTFWPGRLELISKKTRILLDGAHNPSAWKELRSAVYNNFNFRRLYLIIGVLEDKNIKSLIDIMLPGSYKTLFCEPKINRAAGKEILKKYIVFSDNNGLFWYDTTAEAIKIALKESGKNDLILVTGSLFIVGEIRELLLNKSTNVSGRIPL